jgi:hypothetical protein
MSEKKKKDADEKSDDDGERLATATESLRVFRRVLFEGPSFIATTDERRMNDVFKSFQARFYKKVHIFHL